MATIKIGKKVYRREYFNKCEWCDMRNGKGECSLPKDIECEENYIFKRDYDKEQK